MKVFIIMMISSLVSFLGKDSISGNQDALSLLINFYSILTGVLVAIITIIGDPSEILNSRNWREAFYKTKEPSSQLIKTCCLFYCYLITLLLIFINFIIPLKNYENIKSAIEYSYTFFASIALIWSFNLPIMLVKYQQSKLDNAVKEKRKMDGLS